MSTNTQTHGLEAMFSLAGARALVTGAAGGIGAAAAAALAGAGAAVALVDIEPAAERLRERAEAIEAAVGTRPPLVLADVSDPGAVDRMIAEAVEALGGLDVVHSNAGIISGLEPDLDVTVEAWKHNVDVNLAGMFLTGRAAARQFIAQGTGGTIINTASMSGMLINRTPGEPSGGSAYAAAKAGVIHLTKSQAMQWVSHGIRVNAISPGYIRSGIHKGFSEQKFAARAGQVPMGRFGTVDEVSGVVVFLASPAASYITGANLVVDGGYTCW
jgi:NAD(P)-dependent dehydrogenase (short-subunit alcohol dehydrogenase family)